MSQDLAPAPIPAPTSADDRTADRGVCRHPGARWIEGRHPQEPPAGGRRAARGPCDPQRLGRSAGRRGVRLHRRHGDLEGGTAGWGQGDPSPRTHLGRPGFLGICDPACTRRDRRGVGAPKMSRCSCRRRARSSRPLTSNTPSSSFDTATATSRSARRRPMCTCGGLARMAPKASTMTYADVSVDRTGRSSTGRPARSTSCVQTGSWSAGTASSAGSVVEVAPFDSLEIDTEHDLRMAELLHTSRQVAELAPIPARAVVTDFDGVHTDDRVAVDQTARERARSAAPTAWASRCCVRAGIPVLILSTETQPGGRARGAKLGVEVIAGSTTRWPR